MMPSLIGTAAALMRRDVRLAWRRRGDALQPVWFSVLVIALFAIALNADAQLLQRVSVAVIWVTVLLAGLLTLDQLFRSDAEDGSLEQWLLSPVPLGWLMAARTFSHWCVTTLPLLIAIPLLALLMKFPAAQLPWLMLSLTIGSLLLSLIGAVIAALTVHMRRAGLLMALLALPLYVPVLIFGTAAVTAATLGLDPWGNGLLQLLIGLVIAMVLAPWATAAAMRVALT